MADIPDHLVPRSGLSNSFIKILRIEPVGNGGANFTFRLAGKDGNGPDITVHVEPTGKTMDHFYANAWATVRDVLLQQVHIAETFRLHYEKSAGQTNSSDT